MDIEGNSNIDEQEFDDAATWGDDDDGDDGWDDEGDGGWDDDDDMNEMKVEVPTMMPRLERQVSYVILDENDIERRRGQLISQTADLLYVTHEEASCLLRHYQWKNVQLQQDWFGNHDKVRRSCGVSPQPDTPFPTVGNCLTAYCEENVPGFALNCGHFFCNECWLHFLRSQVRDGRKSVFTSCMAMSCTDASCNHKFGCACNEMVPEGIFEEILKNDVELLDKYKKWVAGSFVEGQANVKWCTRPNCNNVVEDRSGAPKAVSCKCGNSFCFHCGDGAHTPCPCDLVKKWKLKEKSDDATEIWLRARTKQCPKCTVRIEKNRACNHMKCVKCGHDFCWLCKGPWSSHGSSTGGYYICNRYNADNEKGNMTTEEKDIMTSQKILQKYTYYYKRYKSSGEAIKHTLKVKRDIEKSNNLTYQAYMLDAVAKLISSRELLQWTYVMGYYMKAGNAKNLFEFQQEMLIEKTECLQEIVDTNEASEYTNKRKSIIDLTSSIDKFRRDIIAKAESGAYEADLLSAADASSDAWGCSHCSSSNAKNAEFCHGCGSCRRHGELDCKGCKKKG